MRGATACMRPDIESCPYRIKTVALNSSYQEVELKSCYSVPCLRAVEETLNKILEKLSNA